MKTISQVEQEVNQIRLAVYIPTHIHANKEKGELSCKAF